MANMVNENYSFRDNPVRAKIKLKIMAGFTVLLVGGLGVIAYYNPYPKQQVDIYQGCKILYKSSQEPISRFDGQQLESMLQRGILNEGELPEGLMRKCN